MYRICFALFLCFTVSCTSNIPNKNNRCHQPLNLFYNKVLQDSLEAFVSSLDIIPATNSIPEYMIEFEKDGIDTLILMLAVPEITPSWELNDFYKEIGKQICRFPIGATYVCERPVLVRVINDIDISDMVDVSILDSRMANSIDSHTQDGIIYEPFWASAMKLYKYNSPDSLTLLSERYFGKYHLNLRPDYGKMF